MISKEEGNDKNGKLEFRSREIYDEIWGPYITITFSWVTYPMENFHSGDAIQDILNLFSKLNINLEERSDNNYINAHLFQYLIGSRFVLKKGITYNIKEIHGILYCEQSQREISIIVTVNDNQNIFQNWKMPIFRILNSINFH
ncbi:MAG: hypothetical protein ACTSRG_04645 [Candidatus Helarchaeota archaeon]